MGSSRLPKLTRLQHERTPVTETIFGFRLSCPVPLVQRHFTNYGEPGGRSLGIEKARIKRNYVEVNGKFDGLISFNLRTPPTLPNTPSGMHCRLVSTAALLPLLSSWR